MVTPLCDVHRQRMAPFEDRELMLAFACTISGCPRAFDTKTGYFDVLAGRYGEVQRRCPQHGAPMFLESILRNGCEKWCCGRIGCHRRAFVRP